MRRYAVGVLLVGVLATAGCGSSPGRIGPTGVDQLTIPTPSPRAQDFVDGIDNPWLPWAPSARWTYAVEGDGPARALTVRVTAERPVVAGVRATEVESVVSGPAGRTLRRTLEWYAQDTGGNVWLLGADASYADGSGRPPLSWRAGSNGALAGVAMLAAPRVGDGYVLESAPGVAEDRARVLAVDAVLEPGLDPRAGARTGLVQLSVASPLRPGVVTLRWYAPGTGLVAQTEGAGPRLVLTAFRPGTGRAPPR